MAAERNLGGEASQFRSCLSLPETRNLQGSQIRVEESSTLTRRLQGISFTSTPSLGASRKAHTAANSVYLGTFNHEIASYEFFVQLRFSESHIMADPKSESATPKRSASPLEPEEAKRTRIEQQDEPSSGSQSPAPLINGVETIELDPAVETFALTQHYQTRCAIQRSIALVLKHDGFESATPDAMESFTALVESCKDQFKP